MNGVFEVAHPLIQHHLTRLRDRTTPPTEFRALVQRLATLLAYEATKDLEVKPHTVETPLCEHTGRELGERVGLIPILRAGLGMIDPVLELIPSAEVWHLGVYRDEATARPVEYYSRIPATGPVDVALILDPMLATGGSAVAALASLREWEVRKVAFDHCFSRRHRDRHPAVSRGANLRLRNRPGIKRPEVYRAGPGRCGRSDFQHAAALAAAIRSEPS
jgi:uracil phosphoribosyltransferase